MFVVYYDSIWSYTVEMAADEMTTVFRRIHAVYNYILPVLPQSTMKYDRNSEIVYTTVYDIVLFELEYHVHYLLHHSNSLLIIVSK